MVGRGPELSVLRGAMEETLRSGRGATMALEGDAGIGKSRLKREATRIAADLGLATFEGRATPFGAGAYGAVADLLRAVIGATEHAPKPVVAQMVAASAGDLGLRDVDRHHVAEVLGVRFQDSPLAHLEAPAIRLNNMIAVQALLSARSRRGAILAVLEDMHLADDLVRDAVAWLARSTTMAPFVLLLLHRPEYSAPPETTRIRLGELDRESAGRIVVGCLGDVPHPVIDVLAERAGGNPFYLEEIARHLVETGILVPTAGGHALSREMGDADLPHTIESLVASRLDGLAVPARRAAQAASVVGRRFSLDVVSRLPGAERASVDVAELRAREIVELTEPGRDLAFRHAVTRDVAYGTLLRSRRTRLHRATAEALEALYPQERDTLLPALGHHWEQGGDATAACACYAAGARQAAAVYAHEEAERLYRSYLRLAPAPSRERVDVRLELGDRVLRMRGRLPDAATEARLAFSEAEQIGDLVAQGRSLLTLGTMERLMGKTAAIVSLGYARELAERAGDRSLLGGVLSAMGAYHQATGSDGTAGPLLRQALRIKREEGDLRASWAIITSLGLDARRGGRTSEALDLYGEAMRIARAMGSRHLEGKSLGLLGAVLVEIGRLEEAERHLREALAVHGSVGDRRAEAEVLGNLGTARAIVGDLAGARPLYESARAIHVEARERPLEAIILGNLGSIHLNEGRLDLAHETFAEAVAACREVGDVRMEATWLGVLGSVVSLGLGDDSRAGGMIAEARARLGQLGDIVRLAQACCMAGHVALATGSSAQAHLAEATELANRAGSLPESDLGRAIEDLASAQRSFEAGRPLIAGYEPRGITPPVRVWLEEHRPEAIPPGA